MKNLKKGLSLLLSLMLVLGAVSVGGMSASAELAENAQLVLGSDTIIENGEILQTSGIRWFITEDENGITLELSDKTVKKYNADCIYAENLNLTINGSASFNSNYLAVRINNGNLTIRGRFRTYSAIYVDGDLTVNSNNLLGCALNVSSSAGEAIRVGGTFTVNGGSVYAKSESASENDYAIAARELVLNNGEALALGGINTKEVLISTLSGTGKPDSPFEISSIGELKEFSLLVHVGLTDLCAVMLNDIDASNSSFWEPIGNNKCEYTGTFDGLDHKITGLKKSTRDDDCVGLFGRVGVGGIVRNVGVEGGRMNGINDVGGIVGYNNGTITNCYYSGTVSGDVFAGGVAGLNGGTIINCRNTGSVSGRRMPGGITGRNFGTVSNCSNTGNITGDRMAGGVVGENHNGTVTNCYNTGSGRI